MIEAELADGTILEFPDGTDSAVIDKVVKSHLQQPASDAPWTQAAASIASGIVAEPIAGLAGLRAAIMPGPPGAGARAVQATRDALTYVPSAGNSREALQTVGETMQPVTDSLHRAQKQAGAIGEKIGGPTGGAVGEALVPGLLAATGIRRAPPPSLQAGPVANIAARQTIAAGKAHQVPVMTSDVLPPKSWVGKQAQMIPEKIPLVGTGPMRAEQQAARQAAVEAFAGKYETFSYKEIVDSLKAQKNRVKSAAGRVLEGTGNKLDSIGPIPLTRTQQALADAKAALSNPAIASASGKAVDDMGTIEQALSAPQTFSTLKSNRTVYRTMKDGIDPATGSQMPSNAKRLAGEVYDAMSADMDDFARSNLSAAEYAKWKKANSVYADEAQLLTRTRLKRVLDTGDLNPENVQTLLFSKKPSEAKMLHDGLTERGRANARAAIISAIVDDASRLKGGFAPDQFLSGLRKYQVATDTFFKGANRQQLEGLRRVLEATGRAQEAAANPATGQALMGGLIGAGAMASAPVTAAVAGTVSGVARLYESAAVRNHLLRLGSVPKAGPLFDRELAATVAAIAAAATEEPDAQPQRQAAQ